jgi:cytochrome d ubiquinol oxidase subunit II
MGAFNIWPTLSFICIIFMLFVYSVLDGFDLALGILLPFAARTAEEKRSLLGAISPFWDGNEVWLVIAVSTLFAAFPAAYAALLPAFYLPLLFVLVLFILRAVSIESSYGGEGDPALWVAVFSASSSLAVFCGLVFISLVVSGISVNGAGGLRFRISDVLGPLPPH